MREIVFRGKRIATDNWVEGSLLNYGDGDYDICNESGAPGELFKFAVYPKTVGQFTGLTDKNGNRIFEGDICTYPDGWVDYAGDGVETFSIGVVTWDAKKPSFYLTNNIGVEWDEIWDSVDEITVIGNIHDNPELLEVPS